MQAASALLTQQPQEQLSFEGDSDEFGQRLCETMAEFGSSHLHCLPTQQNKILFLQQVCILLHCKDAQDMGTRQTAAQRTVKAWLLSVLSNILWDKCPKGLSHEVLHHKGCLVAMRVRFSCTEVPCTSPRIGTSLFFTVPTKSLIV